MLAKRHELKYFVDVDTAADLRQELLPYVQKDPYCQPSDSYLVNSLYFDTTNYDFFAQKIEGQRYRHKIRLRTYGENSDRVFLEMKKKINNCIFKNRSSAPFDQVGPLLDSGNCPTDAIFDGQSIFQGVDDILYIARQFQVTPAVGVLYRRRALIGQQDHRLRITFDEQVSAQDPGLGLCLDEKPTLIFDPHRVILEIKVNNWLPLWLARIVQKFNLSLRSISKYCHAVMVQNVNLRDMRY